MCNKTPSRYIDFIWQIFDGSDRSTEPYDNLLFSRPSGHALMFTFYREAADVPIALEMELYGCVTSGKTLELSVIIISENNWYLPSIIIPSLNRLRHRK